jgi:site-specific DNA-cytosine methylase
VVKHWPTPTVQDAKNDGGPSQFSRHTPGLNTAVKQWPTPQASDAQGACLTEKRLNRPKGTQLRESVHTWPTPTANEDAAGTPNGRMQKMLGNHPDIRGTTPEDFAKGQLSADWVGWLMGYPVGWEAVDRDLESRESIGWGQEPDIPRVATGVPNRVDRLKCLGNSIVPQIAQMIFQAIKELT